MKRFSAALFALFALAPACAEVTVQNAWVRATVAQQQATGAFFDASATSSMRLVAAQSPAATKVEIHEMSMNGEVMKMRAVPSVEIPANQSVTFGPGGLHLMLFGLKRPLKEGETVALTLFFEDKNKKQEKLELQVPVRPISHTAHAHH